MRAFPYLRRSSFSIPEAEWFRTTEHFKNAPEAARLTINNAATVAYFHYRVFAALALVLAATF